MYILAECGLVHKYLLKKEDVKRIEEETFFTVTIVKDLDGYEVAEGENKITLSNGKETLVFKKAERTMWDFAYYLDEYSLEGPIEQINDNLQNEKKVAQEADQKQLKCGTPLTGETKECACLGSEIVNQLFKENNLDETLKKLDEVLEVLKIIESKSKYSITDAIEIIPYARSYAANVKSWKTT